MANNIKSKGAVFPGKSLSLLLTGAVVSQACYFPAQYLMLLGAICILLCIFVLKFENCRKVLTAQFMIILAIGILYILSAVFAAQNKYLGMVETLKFLILAAFYAAAGYSDDREWALKGALNGCFIVCVLGLLAFMDMFSFPDAVLFDGKSYRLQSVLQYANTTALLMGLGIFLTGMYSAREQKFNHRIKYTLMNFVFFLSLVLTLSRGSILVFIPAFVVWLIFSKSHELRITSLLNAVVSVPVAFWAFRLYPVKNYLGITLIFASALAAVFLLHLILEKKRLLSKGKLIAAVYVLCIASVVVILVLTGSTGRLSRLSLSDGTLMERLVMAGDSLRAVETGPLFGIGPGNWYSVQHLYRSYLYFARYVHSGILQIALDAGIIASLLFMAFIVLFYINIIKKRKEFDRAYLSTIIAVISFIVLHSFMDVDLSFTGVFLMLVGFISLSDSSPYQGPVKKYKGLKPVLCGALALTTGLSLYLCAGQITDSRAKAAEGRGDYRQAFELYKQNLILKPMDPETCLNLIRCSKYLDDKYIGELLKKGQGADLKNPALLRELAEYYQKEGQYGKAYENAFKSISLDPLNKSGYKLAADNLYSGLKNGTIGEADYKSLVENISANAAKANAKLLKYRQFTKSEDYINIDKKITDMLK